MNKELEEKLRDEYRDYTINEARKAVVDASKIDYYNGALSATLLQLRVSPYHYWRQKRITEMMKNGELETEGSGNSP